MVDGRGEKRRVHRTEAIFISQGGCIHVRHLLRPNLAMLLIVSAPIDRRNGVCFLNILRLVLPPHLGLPGILGPEFLIPDSKQ